MLNDLVVATRGKVELQVLSYLNFSVGSSWRTVRPKSGIPEREQRQEQSLEKYSETSTSLFVIGWSCSRPFAERIRTTTLFKKTVK